jgi:hypothetical protein
VTVVSAKRFCIMAWLPRRRTSWNPYVSKIAQTCCPERLRSLPNRDLNLSYENLGMQTLLNLRGSRRLEKQCQSFYQVGARFLDGSALTGDIEFRTKGDVSIAVSFDHGCQAANLFHGSIVIDTLGL